MNTKSPFRWRESTPRSERRPLPRWARLTLAVGATLALGWGLLGLLAIGAGVELPAAVLQGMLVATLAAALAAVVLKLDLYHRLERAKRARASRKQVR